MTLSPPDTGFVLVSEDVRVDGKGTVIQEKHWVKPPSARARLELVLTSLWLGVLVGAAGTVAILKLLHQLK